MPITSSYNYSIKHQLQKYKNIMKIAVSFTDIKEAILKKAIFIHIQKTVGTMYLIRQTYGNGQVSVTAISWIRIEIFENIRISHLYPAILDSNMLPKLIKDRFSFTFLREPRDRVISAVLLCTIFQRQRF